MKHPRLFAGFGLAAVLAGSVSVASTSAAPPSDGNGLKASTVGTPRAISRASLAWLPERLDPNTPMKVIVTVAGNSVAEAEGAELDAGTTFTAADEAGVEAAAYAAQARVADDVEAAGGDVQAQHVEAINAMTVVVPAGQLDSLADNPDVVAISPVKTYTRDNANSNAYTAVTQAWESYGLTGAGVKVAIIDDGIDYTHADFGGAGDPAAYAANDRNVVEPGSFPTAKVVAGYDFVGDDYDAASTNPALHIPVPDADPLACGEHGTHVAGTTAGQGVLADGSTYTGPYDTSLDPADFSVSPGSAPEASLMAYKVFGCDGSVDTAVLVAALDRAVADGADVINMSLGSDFGYFDDPDAAAADNAAKAGAVVVISAGNAGDSPYIVGGPSTGKRVISVAALDAGQSFPGATITSPSVATPFSAINANGSTALPITGTIEVIGDDAGEDPLACDIADFPATAPYPDTIYVVTRGTCARVDKALNGEAAGAIAVVMINNAASLPPFEGNVPGLTIPFAGVSSADGAALKALDGTSITIASSGIVPNPEYTFPANFTSGGPRSGDSGQKPDLIAPGVAVASAAVGSGTQSVNLSGTSMAAPHVAGIAALVVQEHPDWSPTMVKAALVSTADPTKVGGFDTRIAGNGLVNPLAALTTGATIIGRDGESAVNFGFEELNGSYVEIQSVKIRNSGDAAVTYDLSSVWNSDAAGTTISIFPSRVTVAPHRSRDVYVKISISKTAAAAFPSADVNGSLFTLRGQIVATPTSSVPTLRVPFLLVPHSRSDVEATAKRVSRTSTGKAGTVTVRNHGFVPGTADVYTWLMGDTRDRHARADSRAIGVQYLDIGAGEPLIVFAFADLDRYANAAEQYEDVYIDVDGDGVEDVEFLVADSGLVEESAPNGVVGSYIFDLVTGDGFAVGAAAAPDGSVVFGYAFPSLLGMTPTSGPATILFATTVSLADNSFDDFNGTASFNPYSPQTSQGNYEVVAPRASVNIPVQLRTPTAEEVPALGWMIVSVDDESGRDQAELINA